MPRSHSCAFFTLFITLYISLHPISARAETEKGLEEILGGFEDEAETAPGVERLEDVLKGFEEEAAGKKRGIVEPVERWWDLDGYFSLSTSYNYAQKAPQPGQTDYRGFSRLRAKVFLELDLTLSDKWKGFLSGTAFYDFIYGIRGRDNYTDDVLSIHEKETDPGEAYLQGTLFESLDLKAGRQIVVWGKSDNIRITDVLNPLDNREPGMVDIENLRLPVAMTKLDYYFGSWDLSLIAIHEKRFSKIPASGSDFFPLPVQRPPEDVPAEPEYAVALNGIFTGWDISFYTARIYDNNPRFQFQPSPQLRHDLFTMAGLATNVAFGNWLLKIEAALFDGLEYATIPGEKKSRVDALAGLEYQGLPDQVISFEVANRHITGFRDAMKDKPDFSREDEFQTALRYSGNFIHDRLHITLLLSTFGSRGEDGGFHRSSAEYDINDSISLTGGAINYESGDILFFRNIGNNDRLFLEARYSF